MATISKKLRLGAFAGFAALASSAAHAESFVGQLAISDVDGFDSGLAVVLGYQKEQPRAVAGLPGLGFRGEFSTTVSNPERSIAGLKLEASYYTLGGYGTYTAALNPQFSAHGKAGFVYSKKDFDTVFGSESDSDFGLSIGFGGTYKLNPQMDFIAEYTIVDSDINHLSAGINYRF